MVTENATVAPYAPVDNVLKVIRRFRERGLPSTLTLQELERLGIPAGNAPRTLVALRFLGLIDEDAERTQVFERLRKSTTDEYPGLLAEIIRSAYAPIFTIVDPDKDGDIATSDAFRQYTPGAQRGRMVTLFLGLCREAGIISGGPPTRRSRVRKIDTSRLKVKSVGQKTKGVSQEDKAHDEPPGGMVSSDYRVLAALIQQLPKEGRWSKSKRDRWIQAMTAAVDYHVELVEEDQKDQ